MSDAGGQASPSPGGGPVRFHKLSGAGNDFLALVEPPAAPDRRQIQTWCRRGLSLGADGLFIIERGTLDRDPAAVRMVHFNADGSRAELCLNGSRCAARLAFHLGWAEGVAPEARERDELQLVTDVGGLRARDAGGDRVAVELPDIVGEPEARTLGGGAAHRGGLLTVGVPHFVLPWPDGLARAPVDRLGKLLRAHPDLGAAGANIDFVRVTSRSRCELRTFERGVEAETLACGTGVVATVAAGVAAGELDTPATVLTAGGHELIVRGGPRRPAPWELEGDARILARGELLGGSAAMPPAPTWS